IGAQPREVAARALLVVHVAGGDHADRPRLRLVGLGVEDILAQLVSQAVVAVLRRVGRLFDLLRDLGVGERRGAGAAGSRPLAAALGAPAGIAGAAAAARAGAAPALVALALAHVLARRVGGGRVDRARPRNQAAQVAALA